MSSYMNASGNYYEGDQVNPNDTSVPKRPNALHVWEGDRWTVPHNSDIDAQIAELEAIQEAKMTPRAKREFYLRVLAALRIDPSENPRIAELADIQSQIVTLRTQRT